MRKRKPKPKDEFGELYSIGKQLTKKIRENILSGRWDPQTPAERDMLKNHLEKEARKNKKRK